MSDVTKFAVLLRGVNVGGRKVSMSELKSVVEKQGFGNVSTLLQSGNVILSSDLPAVKIEPLLEKVIGEKFGYVARVFVYPMKTLQAIVKHYPFGNDPNFQHYVIFLKAIDPHDLANMPHDRSLEALEPGKGVVYWKVRKGYTIKSTFSKQLVKTAYKNRHTVRNINTLNKMIVKSSVN